MPALHTHCEKRLLPTADVLPNGQSWQVEDPGRSEYLPASQSVHVAATDAPVAVEYFPAPQSVHVVATDAPVAVEYFPAPQSVHVEANDAPVAVEYLPAPQSAQVFHAASDSEVSTPARMDTQPVHATGKILIYRAITGMSK